MTHPTWNNLCWTEECFKENDWIKDGETEQLISTKLLFLWRQVWCERSNFRLFVVGLRRLGWFFALWLGLWFNYSALKTPAEKSQIFWQIQKRGSPEINYKKKKKTTKKTEFFAREKIPHVWPFGQKIGWIAICLLGRRFGCSISLSIFTIHWMAKRISKNAQKKTDQLL